MRSFNINNNDAGQRIDKFLQKAVPKLPDRLMYKYIRLKRIKRNGKRCEASEKLCQGDIIELYINDEFFEDINPNDFMSVSSSIKIVYEDDNVLFLDKPCGLVVHEDDDNTLDTLINRVKKYLFEKGEYIPEDENSFAPSLCNRLDRNTQGIVICAKNAESLRIMNLAVKERLIEKKYLCITTSRPVPKKAVIEAYLVKNESENKVRIYNKRIDGSKKIITGYETLKTSGGLTLCEINLITGRTHQIRAHMAYIGCALLGDGKYGSNEINRRYGVKTQALCAYKLRFLKTDKLGSLSYLCEKEFVIEDIWFKKYFE